MRRPRNPRVAVWLYASRGLGSISPWATSGAGRSGGLRAWPARLDHEAPRRLDRRARPRHERDHAVVAPPCPGGDPAAHVTALRVVEPHVRVGGEPVASQI